jgi:cytochrome c oxidase subunit 1
MMFLFAVPIMTAFAIYLVPLMLGARNIAYPRLNSLAIGCFCLRLFPVLHVLHQHGPRRRVDGLHTSIRPAVRIRKARRCMGAARHVHEISALIAALEIIVTVFKMRAPA